jgi:hypothetical protein
MFALVFARARTALARHETVNMRLLVCTSALTFDMSGPHRRYAGAVRSMEGLDPSSYLLNVESDLALARRALGGLLFEVGEDLRDEALAKAGKKGEGDEAPWSTHRDAGDQVRFCCSN